ncbi:MAG TPA: hypothetical protein VGR48_06710 [Terriglobales bacterium]|nr:hypothetical protein [Terriglobales bacterium]
MATISVQTTPGPQIPKDFVGFSLEVSTAGQGLARFAQSGATGPSRAEYALGSPTAPNHAFFQFMRNLGPGVLRLGGNSQDNTCWDSGAAPHPDRCQGQLSAADFRLYSEAAKASGWRLIVGLNLKQNSSQWALSEVTQGIAKQINPQQVLGLEIGNEPDLFGEPSRPKTYSSADQVKDFKAYAAALRQNPLARQYPLIGPAACCRWRNAQDLGIFMDGVGSSRLKLVTVHDYPATTCNRSKVTVEQLLSPELMTRFNDAARTWVAAARQRKLPIALAETNSASCGGMPGVSNAFASALWGLDWLFSGAEDGFTSVNFHISYRPGGSSYDPIDTYAGPDGSSKYENLARPLYYAMYLFAHSASGQYLLPAKTQTTANIRSYATSACSTCAVNVVVINKDSSASGRVRVHLDRRAGAGTLLFLKAPNLNSLSPEVTYGGMRFDRNGHIADPHTAEVRPDPNGDYEFALPQAAAALLTISRR